MFANGGAVPPQPPRCFKAIHACNKKRKHHAITTSAVRESRADHFVCKKGRGCAPPIPSLFSGRPCMQQQRSIMPSPGLQYRKVVLFTLFVLDIFRKYLKPASYHRIFNDMVMLFEFHPSVPISKWAGTPHLILIRTPKSKRPHLSQATI